MGRTGNEVVIPFVRYPTDSGDCLLHTVFTPVHTCQCNVLLAPNAAQITGSEGVPADSEYGGFGGSPYGQKTHLVWSIFHQAAQGNALGDRLLHSGNMDKTEIDDL